MKFAFIVNPMSGQGKHDTGLIPEIEAVIAENPDKDIKMYTTAGSKDATVIADAIAKEAGEDVVIFACGGDGTTQEVANGIYGHDNAILGIMPVGSGNDFVREIVRTYGKLADYKDPKNQLDGSDRRMDLMRITWSEDGHEESRLVANGINIGFDGNTAILASELKELPLISGSGAYLLAVFSNLIKKNGQNLHIIADGEEFHNGPLLLATSGNGGYCGGGIRSCPYADLSDGLIELMAITDVPRRKFIRLFPKFMAGKIFEAGEDVLKIIAYKQAKDILIEPLAGPTMRFVADGEILETGALHVEIVPEAIRVWTLQTKEK